jgi:hypothetical protein
VQKVLNALVDCDSTYMPGSARLDAPGVLHHVMGRRIEKKDFFK